MVTEQQVLDLLRETAYKPMTVQELESHFQLEGAEEFKEFVKLLNGLEERGEVLRTRKERYGVPERMDLLRGKLQVHQKGFAFLLPEDKDHPDVYIHANDLKGGMNGDTVLVRVNVDASSSNKMEGEVIRIVQRANSRVVGTFEHHESYGFVIPDDKRVVKDIFIPKEAFHGAVDGQKVVVDIVRYPDARNAALEGAVVEILGHKNDPGVDILSIIRKYDLPEAFPPEVMAEAEAAPDTISEEEIQGRRDLRGKRIVTIDGEDAKDLDDAVHVERLDNGHIVLGVHIADVGYYVRERSELDKEAYNRGTSVYLVDRVIPMLPHRLSNGICSLNPQVDRLTLSCEMEFDENTKVVRHDIFTSVIKTAERMTYKNVKKILVDEDPELIERYRDLIGEFKLMEELAMRLRRARMARGAIDFDFVEAKILVDENGKPYDIVKRERTVAEQIIEEFMLAANETVAEHFHWLKVPFLYRIHEDPDAEKLQHFVEFVTNFGYVVRGHGNSVHPRSLQSLLEQIKGTKEETVISTVMLRSMKQAKYDAECLGHFGLATDFYTHFTSPIRRYPDLVIHRIIREVVENGGALPDHRVEQLAARMPDIAQQSSERERVAVDAERETDDLKKAEFMLDKVGEDFDGLISGVTNFGIFVELENTVEGLIRLSELSDDYYHYHEDKHLLIGERTSRIYGIGDEVRVRVARVNLDEKTIDFELLEAKNVQHADPSMLKKRKRGGADANANRGGGARGGGQKRRAGKAGGGGGGGANPAKRERPAAAEGRREGKRGRPGAPAARGGGGGSGNGGNGGGKTAASTPAKARTVDIWGLPITGGGPGNGGGGRGGKGKKPRTGGGIAGQRGQARSNPQGKRKKRASRP